MRFAPSRGPNTCTSWVGLRSSVGVMSGPEPVVASAIHRPVGAAADRIGGSA